MSSGLAPLVWVICRGIAVIVLALTVSVLAGIGIRNLVNADTLAEIGFGAALLIGGSAFFVALIQEARRTHSTLFDAEVGRAHRELSDVKDEP